jgi:hypothetical protein
MMGSESLCQYFLVFYLEGRDEPLIYEVDGDTSERVRRSLEGTPDSFCCFSTTENRELAICFQHIELVQFLWQPRAEMETEDHVDSNEGDYEVIIHFHNRSEPFKCNAAHPIEIYDLFDSLQLGTYIDDPFLSFTDEDGELVVLDGRKLLYVETSSEIIGEGLKEMNWE